MRKTNIIFLLMSLVLIGISLAVPFSPQGNIDMKRVYNMTNLSFFEAFTMSGNISGNSYWLLNFKYDWLTNDVYNIFNGTKLTFNETKMNNTVTSIVSASNSSLKSYVDSQDLLFNSSIKNYSDLNNASMKIYVDNNNASMKGYVDNLVLLNNDSIKYYIALSNDSMKSYVNSQDLLFNSSMKNYTDLNNASMKSYVDLVNSTIINYTNSQDVLFNDSMRDYVNSNNASMKSYVDSINSSLYTIINNSNTSMFYLLNNSNTSMKALVDTKLNITDQRYNDTLMSINYSKIINGPVACGANTFLTYLDFAGNTVTCTSVQETPLSLLVNGNLTVTGYIFGDINATNLNVNSSRYSNNSGFLNSHSEANLNVNSSVYSNSSLYSNNSGLLGGKTEANLNVNKSDFWDNLNTSRDITQVGTLTDLNITGNLSVKGINATGNVWIVSQKGALVEMNNFVVHDQELMTNTLLDKSRSTITVTNGIVNYTLFAVYGCGQFNFNATLYPLDRSCVASASVSLFNGTNTVPKMNYIHFKLVGTTPTLTTTESYPSYEHIDVATFIIGNTSATDTTVYGYSRNRYEVDTFVNRVISRYEDSGTLYVSGLDTYANTSYLNISTGVFYNGIFEMTTTNIVDISKGFYFLNGTGQYVQANSLAAFTQYSNGVNFAGGANERVNIVWGIVPINTTGGLGPTQARLVAVLPSYQGAGNEYTSIANAIQDNYGTLNYFPPQSDLKSVFTPVARTILRPSTDLFEPFTTGIYYRFIAGTTSTGGAAPTPGTTNHAALDNLAYASSGHTGFVPSTGASENVDLGNYNLTSLFLYGKLNWSYLQNIPADGIYITIQNSIITFNTSLASTNLTVNKSNYWDDYNTASQLIDTHNHTNSTLVSLDWTKLQTYPAACPADTFVTTIGDSITCTGVTLSGLTNTHLHDTSNITGTFNNLASVNATISGKTCYDNQTSCNIYTYFNGTCLITVGKTTTDYQC